MLPGLAGTYAKLAVVAGALVEQGASPMALAEVLPERVLVTLASHLALERIWDQTTQDRPLPAFEPPLDQAVMREIEPAEAAHWLSRVAPARETDIMAGSSSR
ncbi:hypothetical protein KDL01_18915 [Actinospica durhamensis]|uniref:Uncharacterized protein n=1 Tax=Actinospica durhamensis TaxID=1508375 RepID=A0A941ERV0_9ACTN|nr:hypothetical protein [Actinospica durhamensis]MBR7835353.1 hypothetical protein [Actinospica durhamensis]